MARKENRGRKCQKRLYNLPVVEETPTLPLSSPAPTPSLSSISRKKDLINKRQQRFHNSSALEGTSTLPLPEPLESPNGDRNTSSNPHGCYSSERTNGNIITDVDPPFSLYTTRQKWLIITMAGFAGLFRSVFLTQRISYFYSYMAFKSSHSQHLLPYHSDPHRRIPYLCRTHQRHRNSLHVVPRRMYVLKIFVRTQYAH